MEFCPYRKADRSPASLEIPHKLCNPTVHCHIHQWPPRVSIRQSIATFTSDRHLSLSDSPLPHSPVTAICPYPTVHCHIHQWPPPVPIRQSIATFTSDRHLSLSWTRATHSSSSHPTPKIHFNIVFPSTSTSSKLTLLLRFAHQNPLLSHIHATCPAHLILLDHPKIFGEGCC